MKKLSKFEGSLQLENIDKSQQIQNIESSTVLEIFMKNLLIVVF